MRARLTLLTLVLLALALAACSGSNGRMPGEFRVGIEAMPSNLDPRYAADAHSVRIVPLIYNGLMARKPDGGVEPDLARSWENPDPLTHILQLKEKVLFHDGTALTSRDVAATYRFMMDPANGSPHSGTLKAVAAIETPSDHTIIFRLAEPYVSFPYALTLGILPSAHASSKKSGEGLPGTGPFRLESVKPGEELVLTPFEKCFSGAPFLSRIKFRILPNMTTRLLEIKTGGVDLLQNAVPPYSVKFLEREKGLKVMRSPGSSYQYLGFNMKDPALSNPLVRRAISHGVDKKSLIDFVMQGQARPATGIFTPEHKSFAPEAPTPAYDPEQAKKLLDEAGYPDPDGEGPLPRLSLSYKTSTDKTALEVANVIADQLTRVGIKVDVRGYEWGTFFGDVKKGDFQLMSLRWVGLTDPDVFHYLFHSSSIPPSGANRGRYINPRVDALIEESRREPDEQKRNAIYRKIQETVSADGVYVSLYWLDNINVLREGFTGFTPLPGGEYTSLAKVRPVN